MNIEKAIEILNEDVLIMAMMAKNKDVYDAVFVCRDALEKQLNGGWTNAIEKPSKSDDYLVYYHKKYDSCNFETNLHGICSFIDIYGGWQTEEGETILAWQSLPEPYKEA